MAPQTCFNGRMTDGQTPETGPYFVLWYDPEEAAVTPPTMTGPFISRDVAWLWILVALADDVASWGDDHPPTVQQLLADAWHVEPGAVYADEANTVHVVQMNPAGLT